MARTARMDLARPSQTIKPSLAILGKPRIPRYALHLTAMQYWTYTNTATWLTISMSGFGYEFVSVCEGCLCRLDIADFIIVLLAVSVPIVTLKIDMKYPKER